MFLGLSDDPNEKADELYAQAAQLVESAKQAKSYSEALPLYEQAKDILERIVSQYADSTIAVGLVSGQTKISSVTLSEFRELEGSLKRYARAEQDPLSCALVAAETEVGDVVKITHRYVKAGQIAVQAEPLLSQALDLAHAIKDDYDRASTLVSISHVFVEAGQTEKAGPLLSQALDIANTYQQWENARLTECEYEGEFICGDYEPRTDTVDLLVKIALGLTRVDHTAQAEQVLSQASDLSKGIGWEFYRYNSLEYVSGALVVVADQLTEAGQFTQALNVANTIELESDKANALVVIADGLARAGQTTRAEQVLSQALLVANAITIFRRDRWKGTKFFILRTIVDRLAEVGHTAQAEQALSQALNTVDAIQEEEEKADGGGPYKTYALESIAGGFAKIGQFAQALDIANAFREESTKAQTLASIACRLIEAGHTARAEQILSQALNVANAIKSAGSKDQTLAFIARELTKVGQVTQALNIANTPGVYKDRVLTSIVYGLTEAGHIAQALDVANTIKEVDIDKKVLALSSISRGLTEASHTTQAEQILSQALILAKTINEDQYQPYKPIVLRLLVDGLIKAGQSTQAEQVLSHALILVKTIKKEEWQQALALADIASGFVKTEHQPSEGDIAILREIVQTAIPMEKAWERIKKNEPG